MSIVVTGGAGYIGAHVVRALQQQGERVVVIDDLSSGSPERIGSAALRVIDVAADGAAQSIASVLRESDARAVIHFAAKKQVGESVLRPVYYYRQNVTGLANVLDAMESVGVRSLVFSSSAAVYGVPDVPLVSEDTPPQPINPYGETKLAGEWLVRGASRAWGLRAVALRYFNVAGAGAPDLGDPAVVNLVTIVLERLTRGEPALIYGDDYPTPDGTGVRDYVHVQDLAEAHIVAMRDLASRPGPRAEIFNVGTGTGASVLEVIREIAAVSGRDVPVHVVARRLGDPPSVIASTARIEAALGWRARFGLPEIVRSAWEAWQAGNRTAPPAS